MSSGDDSSGSSSSSGSNGMDNDDEFDPTFNAEENHRAQREVSINDSPAHDTVPENDILQSGGNSDVGSQRRSLGKRKYNFVNRTANPRPVSLKRQRWIGELQSSSDVKLRRTKCCQGVNCFQKVNLTFLRAKQNVWIRLQNAERRAQLLTLADSEGVWWFDGIPVCGIFLRKAFHFSGKVLSSVREQILNGDSMTASRVSEHLCTTVASSQNSFGGRDSPQRDSIVCFLERLAEDTADCMPDNNERHLPYFRKKDVFEQFLKDFSVLNNGKDPPRRHYFLRTWKRCCPYIKIRKRHRFAICTQCEELRMAIRSAVEKRQPTEILRAQKRSHNEFIRRERREYRKKCERAILQPYEYCSIVIDGADQSTFGLPHFTVVTKTARGHSLKVKLVGLLQHKNPNVLRLYTMTEEHQSGANHIVETIHRFLVDSSNENTLAPTLFIQLDNCSRENKNRFLMSYLESLVCWGVFKEIEVGFLPVGHTHSDIDQCFSRTSAQLRSVNATTLKDLQFEIGSTYNDHTRVSHLKRISNWSGLCEQERCIQNVTLFSRYRYFRFVRKERRYFNELEDAMIGTGVFLSGCFVKTNSTDEWSQLQTPSGGHWGGFLKFCPDLSRTPDTIISMPPGLHEVNRRLESEEGRINDISKLHELYELRDFVFQSRVDKFHWNLNESIEVQTSEKLRESFRNNMPIQSTEMCVPSAVVDGHESHDNNGQTEIQHETPGTEKYIPSTERTGGNRASYRDDDNVVIFDVRSNYTYEANSFVAVQPCDTDDGTNGPFWIGKVLSSKTNKDGVVIALRVHWFGTTYDRSSTSQCDYFRAAFYPQYVTRPEATRRNARKRRLSNRNDRIPYTDEIASDSVLVNFGGLTKRHVLPIDVQNKLQTQ